MQKLASFFLLTLLVLPVSVRALSWMDRSHSVFLPNSLNAQLTMQMDFPLFWWNFVIIEPQDQKPAFALANEFCQALRQHTTGPQAPIKKSACPDLSPLLPLITSWSQDLFSREPAPSRVQVQTQFSLAMTKASQPLDRALLDIVRYDPMNSVAQLQSRLLENVSFGFTKENGFFVDKTTKRIILPFQMTFPPSDTQTTRQIVSALPLPPTFSLIGPHFSTLENEDNVMQSLDRTTLLGVLLLFLQIALVIWKRRWSYFLLIPPVLGGMLGATLTTVAIYGSIHGLTLSLGAGLIALALDYGLHSAHNIRWKGVWKANLFGLLTTFAGLLSIALSDIPLLQQMMVFASSGLALSYLFYYLLHTAYPQWTYAKPFAITIKTHKLKTTIALALSVLGIICAMVLKPDLNMHQFDAQSPATLEKLRWLYSHIHQRMPLFSVRPLSENTWREAEQQKTWAQQHSLSASNFSYFVAPPEEQLKNLESWKKLCPLTFFNNTEKILFDPFLSHWPCENLPTVSLQSPPEYIKDMVTKTHWLTSWFPQNDQHIKEIQSEDPLALSLRELIQKFPEILQKELQWMLPLSILICLALLTTYFGFRKWRECIICLLPFFCGGGAYFFCVLVFGWSFSFISVVALIMVFGLSLDYGIFAANLYLLERPPPAEGVWSCLALCALITILGFLPLAVCQHPVLRHLGQTLVMGSLGTWIGTAWGIPGVFAWLKKEPLL